MNSFNVHIFLFYASTFRGDHCGRVAAACKEKDTNQGPAIVRTPYGLTLEKWQEGLDVYAAQLAKLQSTAGAQK